MQQLVAFKLVTLTLGMGCATHAFAQTTETDFALDPEIRKVAVAHVGPSIARAIQSYTSTEEIDHKGNFGKVETVDTRAEFVVLGSGLLGSNFNTVFRSGKAQGSARGVSLCGFLPLLTESSSTTDTSATSVVPVGKLFVPFGIKSSIDFTNRTRLVTFESSTSSICNPEAGSEFTYRTEVEFVRKTSGLFGRTSNGQRVTSAKCKVDAEPLSASKLNPTLRGDYFRVACETEISDGKKKRAEYGYLREAGIYLLIEAQDEWQRSTMTYTDIVFTKPQ